MIRKAVVLCAGEGLRLRPLTFSRPKHLLPVAGKPILSWALEALRDAGITQAALVVGHHEEAVRRYVSDGEAWGMSVEYVTQPRPHGLGHAVMQARDYVQDDSFVVYLGDNLFERGISDFVRSLDGDGWDAALLLKSVPDPTRFGVAEVEGERVTRVAEKPARPASDLAITGVYAFHQMPGAPGIFDAIDSVRPSPRGEIEITDAIQQILQAPQARVRWARTEGLWEDAGEPTALLRANSQWLRLCDFRVEGAVSDTEVQGAVSVGRGARVRGSRLVGPCRIGRNCTVEDALIGPDVSIDEGCQIIGTRLTNCIVQRNCQIQHLRAGLVNSVLGEHVEIAGGGGEGGTPLSVLMSDMSHVRAQWG